MKTWQALHTALIVAKTGTVSQSALHLNCERSTVIRHIDLIENWLGVDLFIRHSKGYDLTEAGRDFIESIQFVEQQISTLRTRLTLKEARVDGTLVISTLEPLMGLFAPSIKQFITENPHCRVDVISSPTLEPLEKGEVQLALRPGTKPDNPDYVPVSIGTLVFGIFGAKNYVMRKGVPKRIADLSGYQFIGSTSYNPRIPFSNWFEENISAEQVAATSSGAYSTLEMINEGIGLGALPDFKQHDDLIRILPKTLNWESKLWAVSHVNVNRTLKVQKFLQCLKNTLAI